MSADLSDNAKPEEIAMFMLSGSDVLPKDVADFIRTNREALPDSVIKDLERKLAELKGEAYVETNAPMTETIISYKYTRIKVLDNPETVTGELLSQSFEVALSSPEVFQNLVNLYLDMEALMPEAAEGKKDLFMKFMNQFREYCGESTFSQIRGEIEGMAKPETEIRKESPKAGAKRPEEEKSPVKNEKKEEKPTPKKRTAVLELLNGMVPWMRKNSLVRNALDRKSDLLSMYLKKISDEDYMRDVLSKPLGVETCVLFSWIVVTEKVPAETKCKLLGHFDEMAAQLIKKQKQGGSENEVRDAVQMRYTLFQSALVLAENERADAKARMCATNAMSCMSRRIHAEYRKDPGMVVKERELFGAESIGHDDSKRFHTPKAKEEVMRQLADRKKHGIVITIGEKTTVIKKGTDTK